MDVIEQMPYAFPKSQHSTGVRKFVLTPQTIAYYHINEDVQEIEIIAIIDSRQDFTL